MTMAGTSGGLRKNGNSGSEAQPLPRHLARAAKA